ncbi:alpha/beta hydrolase [Thermobispora bispora]|uniref:alpha/beta hydrolase n=1 Tax=Thermobispora bispora TaxID=2006 RepID=UPI001F12201A|nr:alpha/beta hydrolase [Thermobispora bispora]
MAADTATELELAFTRVVRLGQEYAGVLDSPYRCLIAKAWVGGGAPVFAEELRVRRARVQAAFQEAAAQIAEQIHRQGGRRPAVPTFATPAAVVSPAPSGFAGMDIPAMQRLIAGLERAGQELRHAGARVGAELRASGLPAAPGHQISGVGVWAHEQVPGLRRRLELIQRDCPGGLTTPVMTGFGLFGGYAPDRHGVGALLDAAATGDVVALQRLVELQSTGADRQLAARVNAWWQSLGAAERQRLLTGAPHLLGRLDGLPATVRDQANRAYLAQEKQAVTAELARLRQSAQAAEARVKELEGRLRQITAVERALALGGRDGRPPALLLLFDPSGPGKAAISFGDPDEATSIVVSVPGTGTTLEGFAGDAQRAVRIWDQASAVGGPNSTIASIAWLGYDAPQWGSILSSDRSPANLGAAEKGAPALASFTDGLRAAHLPTTDARLTVIGHSYGSTLTGAAARLRPHAFADQLIFLGSPGAGARHASELGVKSVWVGEAPDDPVADLGIYGADPSDAKFGGQNFYVQEASDFPYSLKAHSIYWERGSASLRNLGYLVTGQYAKLVPFPVPTPSPNPSPLPPGPAAQPSSSGIPAGALPSPQPFGG